MRLADIWLEEAEAAIKKLGNNKSFGLDTNTSKVLKNMTETDIKVIQYLCQLIGCQIKSNDL